MKSVEELKKLYESELKPQLVSLEKKRKTIKRFSWWGSFLAIFSFLFIRLIPNQTILIIVAILAVVSVLYLLIKSGILYFSYRKEYKKEVVVKIIKLINLDFYYNPDKHISCDKFIKSKLFSRKPDKCKGDDYISGIIEKTDFEFSELHTEYKTETTTDGKTETTWHTIFSGLFFHADFNKHIEGETFVLPDTAEKLLGKFGQKLQKNKSRGQLVKLENPEFEKKFVVYSTGQQEARYILTPTMMEAMVNMHNKYKRKMHFSFAGERIYCAISFNKGLFEPRIRKTLINFKDIEEMYHLFSLIEVIITEMNLNTRIWTKQ
jgi:hypothetical protein